MQPTSIGALSSRVSTLGPTLGSTNLVPQPDANALVPLELTLPVNFPMTLTAEHVAELRQRLEKFDFAGLGTAQIVTLSDGPTKTLQNTLNGFLDRIARAENPQIFHLLDKFNETVENEKLEQLADEIFNAKPGVWDQVIGFFSKKKLQQAMDRIQEDLARTAKLRSKSLREKLDEMAANLTAQTTALTVEVTTMDALVEEYRKAFVAFALEVAFLHNALAKAKATAPALLAAPGMDLIGRQNIEDKLQALESVALAREGSMTKLPAEQLVIRDLQNAGVSTLQELATTAGERFLSISETLLAIHSAQQIQAVQRLGQSGANLDRNLAQVRAKLAREVVTAASNAPGDNRLAQANQLKSIVAETQSLQQLKDAARTKNAAKFKEASATMSQVRLVLLELGRQSNPAASVADKLQ